MTPAISVLLPTHNPDERRLARTLDAIEHQTLPSADWELIIIDNASQPSIASLTIPSRARIVSEPALGLAHARRCGFREARAPVCVLVDDDNILAPDYLMHVARIFAAHPPLGAIGGKSLPEFEQQPEEWQREFLPLLALRDHGEQPHFSSGLRAPGAQRNSYPALAAPIGAGMALRAAAAKAWLNASAATRLTDRQGSRLSSAGDNDIVFTLMKHGWDVAYFPELVLTHVIPRARLERTYLGRLNRGIQGSWMQLLALHDASPWRPIARWSVPLRQAKAWFTHRAWSGPAAWVRWQGACGHFEGRGSALSL